MKDILKKLISKKGLALVVALLLTLGVCDLTVAEKSRLMPILDSVSELLSDEVAPVTTETEAPKVLIDSE
jgi:hypothetical protein